MEKEVSQQGFSPTAPSLPLPDVATHQDAYGYRAHPRGHFVTHGEKKFDRLTYTTVGYVINALLSVAALWAVERTPKGQKWLNGLVEGAQKKLPSINPDNVKTIVTKSFFLSGGFAVLAPMKWMEDAKLKMIKKWDKNYYGAAAETDENIVQSHKDIEAAPKQGWGSIFASRALALVPFYLTIGALWTRESLLAKATNPELRAMSKDAIHTMKEADPEAFSKIASKGVYVDKYIDRASRGIGKLFAKKDPKALAQIESMEKHYPGTIRSALEKNGMHDPAHSTLPYYFISEAITSGMVAWGVYALTRVLGPIMGKKAKSPAEKKKEAERVPEIHTNANSEVEQSAAPLAKKEDRPETVISAAQLEHQAAVTQPSQQALL